MSRKLLLAALPLLLAASPLFSQDVLELHGYMRSGVGRTSNGGEQVSFFLANTGGSPTGGPGYRLGNETDNYIELAMDVRAYEKGNESFKLHFRPTFREYYSARDASIDAGGAPDGVHPLDTGHRELADIFYEAIVNSYAVVTPLERNTPFKIQLLWYGYAQSGSGIQPFAILPFGFQIQSR